MSETDESTSIRTYVIAGGIAVLITGVGVGMSYWWRRYRKNHFTGKGEKTIWLNGIPTYYAGDMVDGKACGFGVGKDEHITAVGVWKNDALFGTARVEDENSIIEGEFDGLREPENTYFVGTILLKDGTVNMEFDGYFRKSSDICEGETKMMLPDGTVLYEGAVTTGFEPHGFAKRFVKEQTIYEGEVQHSEYHGSGTLIWENGDVYEGRFEHGVRTQGKMKYANDGAIYDGLWRDNAWWTGSLMSKEGKIRQFVDGKQI